MIDVEGLAVRRVLVVELAHGLGRDGYLKYRQPAPAVPVRGHALELPTADRRVVLQALDDPPKGLEELRGALLRSL